MEIILLTHERETQKHTNSGKLVQHCLPEITKTIIWQRKQPDPIFEDLSSMALVYPSEQSEPISNFERFVLIDSTWQEARKIFNRSSYTKALPAVTLEPKQSSQFTLRRNQVKGGLCTCEAVLELLLSAGKHHEYQKLKEVFEQWLLNKINQ